VTITPHVEEENISFEKIRERDFYKCMSDLKEIRAMTLTDGSPKGRVNTEVHRRRMVIKRDALQLALSRIENMKASCAAASDAVFRSLVRAQEEGGHALVSARARNLLLPAHTGSRKSGRSGRKAGREIDIGISQGCYSDLLLLGKELRMVEKLVKQTIGSLRSFGTMNQTEGRDTDNKEGQENFPHSPQTLSVTDKENQQWQNSSASSAHARTTTTDAVATAATATPVAVV
jgi:hypothetical protein